MSAEQIAVFLAGDRTAHLPGATLAVTVLWAITPAPDSVDVRLFWRTQGKGSEDLAIVAEQSMAGALAGEHVVEFRLPTEPWSFSGRLISLIWAVEAVAQPGGQNARCEFVLGPRGREVLLTPLDDAARA
jgi:hypothetical protein